MRIGVDWRPTYGGRGGIPVYVRELASALTRRFPTDRLHLYAHRLRDRAQVRAARSRPRPAAAHLADLPLPSRAAELLSRLGFGADRLVGGCDVFHLTDYAWLRPSRSPLTAIVHDVLFEELPACYLPAMRRGLRGVTRAVVRHAARIVVPSVRTKIALVERFHADAGRIDVVPLAARTLPVAAAAPGGAPYVLSIGTLEPRKNLLRTLDAHARALEDGLDVDLVIAGAVGWRCDDVVARLRGAPRVRWEERPDDARLGSLLAGARALLYPSLGEGFGLPVLEGMAHGIPVVTSAGTACADVAEGAALLVDPYDVDAMADALRRVVEDRALAASLVARGRARAATFSWERTAVETRAVWAAAAGLAG